MRWPNRLREGACEAALSVSAMRRLLVLAVPFVLLSGCLTAHPPRATPVATPVMRPEAFFLGRTTGEGTLHIRTRVDRAVHVESDGRPLDDGTFRLQQTITVEGDAPTTRTWLLRRDPSDPMRYTGTLSDASGEVTAEVDGALLHIRYRLGLVTTMEQWLTLQPDRRTVRNLSTVRALGVPIARLDETITRADPLPR